MDSPSGSSLIHLLKASFKHQGGESSVETQALLDKLENFFSATASDAMEPRTKIVSIHCQAQIKEALKLHHQSGHSRLPVYDKKEDNIVGILHAIDLFPFAESDNLSQPVSKAMRKPLFVSYSQPIHQIMANFRQAHTHMALVVDEYGGVDGVLTLSDILEELVGVIPDEFDKDSDPSYEEVGDGVIVMDANFALEDFNELFHVDFKKEGIETIGGYTIHVLGKIPSKAESFKIDNISFTVEESDERRLLKLRLPAPSRIAS